MRYWEELSVKDRVKNEVRAHHTDFFLNILVTFIFMGDIVPPLIV